MEAHTDFIFSLQWERVDWLYLLLAVAGAVAIVVLLYVRRRARRN